MEEIENAMGRKKDATLAEGASNETFKMFHKLRNSILRAILVSLCLSIL